MAITYTWIPIFTGVVAFVMAYGIGANDVANAFATSVGAKSITLYQALLIASIMEFSGAFLMGSHVTETVANGIIDSSLFIKEPEILMVIMMCALMSAAVWLLIATSYSLPVSTTHSIIGAIIGCGIVSKGVHAVKWDEVVKIIISWFTSPLFSGILSFILFLLIRNLILRHENCYERSLSFFPYLVSATFALNVFFIIYKGTPQLGLDKTPFWLGFLIALSVGCIVGVCSFFFFVPCLRRRSLKVAETKAQDTVIKVESKESPVIVDVDQKPEKKEPRIILNHDVHAELKDEESQVYKIHQNAEVFDASTERVFTFVQVVTATFDSFSHGANDVANAIGPLAAVVSIYTNKAISEQSEVPLWILALGGVGIVIGLATLGYKIMASIGVNLVTVTPSRGFTIELGAAIVVLVGSRIGMPLSTTHCQVGSTVGVGLLEKKGGINWKLFAEVFAGWILTMVVAGGLGAGIFWFAIGTPTALVPFK